MTNRFVGDPVFEYDYTGNTHTLRVKPDEFLDKLFSRVPKLNPVQLRTVLKDLYKVEYGILTRNDIKKPFGSVSLPDSENMNNGHILADSMKRYIDADIYKTFGIDLMTFLDLPLDVVDDMLTVASEYKAKKTEVLDEVNDMLNK